MRNVLLSSLVLTLAGALAARADWPQWRGPGRDGIAAAGPKLLDAWPKAGPAKLWVSEKLPSGGPTGYSCPVVVGQRVFMLTSANFKVPFDHRILTTGKLRDMGWFAEKPPAEVLEKIQAARLSDERKKLRGKQYNAWRDKWIKDNLSAEQAKKFIKFAQDRLNRGKNALDLKLLDKLETVRDEKFSNQAALDKWLADNDVDDKLKKVIMRSIPTSTPKADDMFICLNAADGKTLWQLRRPGKPHGYGISGTISVVDGRAYCIGAKGDLYCIDAEKGEVLWQVPACKEGVHTSALVVDGRIVVLAKTVAAFDVKDGKELWRTKIAGKDPSPGVWKSGGKTYIVTYTGSKAYCLDPADGKEVWSVDVGPGQSSAVIAGDVMVVQTTAAKEKTVGLVAFKLSPTKAEKLWNVTDLVDGSASPVVSDGHVYVVVKDRAACVNLTDGSIVWNQKVAGSVGWGSPVLVDGKLISVLSGGKVLMAKAAPGKYEQLGVARLGGLKYSSPAVVDGKLYIRTKNTIACYDLTKAAEEKPKPGK